VRAAAFSLAVGLVLADSSVAVLALPAIYRELEVDLGDLHWVLTTFNLVLALVPIPAARVTRRAGAVRTFVGGIALVALPMRLWMRHTGRLTRRSWRFGRSFRARSPGGPTFEAMQSSSAAQSAGEECGCPLRDWRLPHRTVSHPPHHRPRRLVGSTKVAAAGMHGRIAFMRAAASES